MKRESDAHAALSQTSKLRMLDALGREIVRERRKPATIGERKPACTCGSMFLALPHLSHCPARGIAS